MTQEIVYVVPCSGAKADAPAPARELYTGAMFRHTFTNAIQCAQLDEQAGFGPSRVLILSAKHGLIDPDTVIEPYDLKMGAAGSVSVQAIAAQAEQLGIDWDTQVYALLPKAYLALLDEALRTLDVYVQDVYEGTAGIGEQRRVNALIGAPVGQPVAQAQSPADSGPQVWLGGGVSALWWGVPVLVSYGRLREAKTLPVATAPWVCDSRGYAEVAQHGRWTVPAGQYIADLRRYTTEIGGLVWAAPQDWPASDRVLERTGLTELEHQQRTIASVLELRAMAPELPIITVVTGRDVAGYLRHVDMYAAAGIDLHAETLPVGVGALLGRPPAQAADIIRALYAAGLRGLHGFGAKGPLLDLVGGLLGSIDSADWSGRARYEVGLCPHGMTVWEANCPIAAQNWGNQARDRAAKAVVQEQLPLFGLTV